MILTQEQQDIINSVGNIKINAVAGSGKTTTIIEYAKSRPRTSRILYLAFNKSVKIEAIRKFAKKDLKNVTVETAHSLAYKNIVYHYQYKVRSQGYKTHEIVELLNLQGNGEKHAEYVIANHINKYISYFCNSAAEKVQDLNYLNLILDDKVKDFVSQSYNYIEKQTRVLLAKMDRGEIEITHDFYLKKFQLSKPNLNYDYILFDEAQDASAAMLDVVLKQKGEKVIVGDTNQQIYGWRFAINSLEKADFKTYELSNSFRFNQDIANLALEVINWKKHLDLKTQYSILGKGIAKKSKVKAIIARTNLGLLLKAIEYVTERKGIKNIYFEGNISSYTYADEGTSLYDVLNLYNKKRHLIRDSLIKQMRTVKDLEEYIEKTNETQLGMMLEIVKEYGNKIPGIIKSLKKIHLGNDEKEKADVIFSTVHRCKGMEYGSVQLVNDFISEEKLKKLSNDPRNGSSDIPRLNEEINLLYVAITRTKGSVYIPESLLPHAVQYFDSGQGKSSVHVLREIEESREEKSSFQAKADSLKKRYKVSEARVNNKSAYSPWTPTLDEELTAMYSEGVHAKDLAKHFGRSRGSIRSRILKLELEDLYA